MSGGFVNDVLSRWEEMKIEHIQNAIDIQQEVMLEIIEKQGGANYISQLKYCEQFVKII